MTAFEELYGLAAELNCFASKDAILSDYTSFKIGGPAGLLVKPDSDLKVSCLIEKCRVLGLKYLILGKGSNVLISDLGYNGIVICTSELNRCNYLGNGIIECSAGAMLSKLCNFALENGLSGVEFAFGIPGSVGGAIYMNAGAYGGEMKDITIKCNHITQNSCFGSFENNEINFDYRSSVYCENGYFITGLLVQLSKGDKKAIKTRMIELGNLRKEKQPYEFPSAGSIFKRPTGYYAGALIEACGLKGKRIGGAMVSDKHAGFIINTGNATANDVLELIETIKETVFHEKGVSLETEIKYIFSSQGGV